jgi:hypothetical protein
MKLTIIPIDGAVYVDDVSHSDLDLNFIPSDVHALQWKETKGWVEFKDNDDGIKPPNQVITELPEWATLALNVWTNWTPPVVEEVVIPNIPVTVV